MKIDINDLPEEIVRQIEYVAKNGSPTMFSTDKRDVEIARERALEEVRNYKKIRDSIAGNEAMKKKYSELLEKLKA